MADIQTTENYEVIVIGGGTAGLRTAIDLVHRKAKVALVEPGILGGTCLNTGCIPTKAMLHAAHMYTSLETFDEFGIKVGRGKLNFKKLMQRVRGIVEEGQDHINHGLDRMPLEIIKEKAEFIDQHTIRAGNKTYTAKRFIIATGAHNNIIPIEGLDHIKYWTNESILDMKQLPKSIIMMGGGYISMEFAVFFAQLGVKVTVLERCPQVLAMLDDDVLAVLLHSLEDMGINIITNADIKKVQKHGHKVKISYNNLEHAHDPMRTISAEDLFVATGRVPNTKGLNCKAAGIKLSHRNAIEVNDMMQTSNPNIFAIGDVTGRAMFAHAAKRQSHIAINNALYGKKMKMPFSLIPWAVFTSPTVAGIGLSEKQATSAGEKIAVMKAPFNKAGRARVIGDTTGFVKLIYQQRSRKLLGCCIVGPRADDIVHEVVTVMNTPNPKVDTILDTIHIHPTLSEVMDSLREV